MALEKIYLKGNINFKIRFNTAHGETDLYWRVIIDETEYLVRSVNCRVNTRSDRSFDTRADAVKFNIAGTCEEFYINEEGEAIFNN